MPTSPAQRYLQANYTVPFGDYNAPTADWPAAIKFDDARDGSPWSAANARFNDFFREIVTRFDFEDALLLDTRGNVVYSAYKGVDLGTNILTGPFKGSELGGAYQKALDSNTVDYVGLTDFGDYQPADEPTAWFVSPVGPQDSVEGVLALQFPISKINKLMTMDGRWQDSGMGQTGETFIVGPDDLMRSNSRLFLEDPDAYKRDVIAAGTPPDVAEDAIRQHGTTLVQPVATEATKLAQQGQRGTLIADDYLGKETLQAYAPADIPGLRWNVIAKIDTAEAFAPVTAFTKTLVLSTAGIIFVVCIAAMLLARLFVRPIRRLETGAQQISSGDYGVAIPVVSRDEFGDLTVAFNDMSGNLAIKEDLLNEQRRENDRIMLTLMPEQVVARYRDGEETIAQDHQDVTVIFADIVGLDELSAGLTSDESLAIVNRLVRQFDAAAENLGIERVRTLRNGYLASCGLNVPRIDNVRRTVDFAVEMNRIIDRFNGRAATQLKLRAGIDTGTVSSGLVGRSSLAYDMWGAAVDLAYQVQSGSPQPGVYVTSDVYDAMRDTRHFTAAGEVNVGGVVTAHLAARGAPVVTTIVDSSWFYWAVGVAIGLPICLVILTEVRATLARRGSGLARPVGLVRNYIVPLAALLLLLVKATEVSAEATPVRIVSTVLGFVLLVLVLSGLNATLFQGAPEGSWRKRIPSIFLDVARFLVIAIGLAIIFSYIWGANVGGLFTALGISSIVLGLTLQNSVGQIISGLLLLFEQPFQLGDWVDTPSARGRVVEVNWRATHIDTGSGLQIIPNSVLAGASFANLSRPPGEHSISVITEFDPNDPPDDVCGMLIRVAATLPQLRPGGTVERGGRCGPVQDVDSAALPRRRWRRAGESSCGGSGTPRGAPSCASMASRTASPRRNGWRRRCAPSLRRCGSATPTSSCSSHTCGSPGTAPTRPFSSPVRCPSA